MINQIRIFRFLFLVAIWSFATVACGPRNQNTKSTLDSVEIAQTEVKNQFRVGFCWAYATTGLLESNYKLRTGETIDLSEEAIGFYRMAEELVSIGQMQRSGRLTSAGAIERVTAAGSLEGWFVRSNVGSRDAMELIDSYGVVSESQWSFKFTSSRAVDDLRSIVGTKFQSLLDSGAVIDLDAVAKILVGPGAFPSLPPKQVSFKSQQMSAVDFARNILGFKSSDYTVMTARSVSDLPRMLGALKRSLASGVSVPIGFVMDFDYLENGVLKATDYSLNQMIQDPNLGRNLFSENSGGHAVLISDFVNDGGSEGAISESELRNEIAKSVDDLAYIKFKNSWGLSARSNESGIPVTPGSGGYYYMDRGYLKSAAAFGRLSIVVPKSIALNSLGQFTVDSRVVHY